MQSSENNLQGFFFKKTTSIVLLFLFSILFYLPTLWHSFAWDDKSVLSSEIYSIKGYGLFLGHGDYYRPFLALAHGLDFAVWYMNPMGFHLTNIILNTLCGIAAYLVFSRLLKSTNSYVPLLCTLLFIIHPAHADSVAWIAGRTDIIASVFFLLAFLAYILYRDENDKKILFLSSLFFLFSLFGKEVGIVLPFIVFFYDIFMLKKKTKDALPAQLPLYIVIVIYFLLRGIPSPTVGIEGKEHIIRTDYIILLKDFLYSFGFYIKKIIFPFNFSIFPNIDTPSNPAFFGAFLLLFVFSIIKRSYTIIFAFLFIIFTILPSMPVALMNTVPTPVAARYLYLPVFGFSLVIIYILDRIKLKYIKTVLFTVIAIIYGTACISRYMEWKDNLVLWESEVKMNNDSAIAHLLRGYALYDEKKYEASEKENIYVINNIESLRTNKTAKNKFLANAHNMLGIIFIDKKEFDAAEKHLFKALQLGMKNRSAFHNLGTVYLSRYFINKKIEMLKDARFMYKESTLRDPNYIDSAYALAYTTHLLGNHKEAVAYYERVVNIDPRSPLALMAIKGIASINNRQK